MWGNVREGFDPKAFKLPAVLFFNILAFPLSVGKGRNNDKCHITGQSEPVHYKRTGDIFSAALAPEHSAGPKATNHRYIPTVKEINSDKELESPTVYISFYPFRHKNDF